MKSALAPLFTLLVLALSGCATIRNVAFGNDPLSCPEHGELGTSYAGQNMNAEAEKEFRKGLDEKKDCTPAQISMISNNLAAVLLEEKKDLKEAARLAQEALENAGTLKPYVLDTLAGIDVEMGRMEKAKQALDQAETLAPVDNKPLREELALSRQKLAAAEESTHAP